LNVNSGQVKRIAGCVAMSDGVFENSYSRSSIDFQRGRDLRHQRQAGPNAGGAGQHNQGLLV
jgi:iron complex outermembrane receptor protein